MQTRTKIVIAVAAAYWMVNNAGFVAQIRHLEKENRLLKEDRKRLVKLTNSLAKHTVATPEEQQLAIDINFENMTKDI